MHVGFYFREGGADCEPALLPPLESPTPLESPDDDSRGFLMEGNIDPNEANATQSRDAVDLTVLGLVSINSNPVGTPPKKIIVKGYAKPHGLDELSRKEHKPSSPMNRRRFEMMRKTDEGQYANLIFSGRIINCLIASTLLKQ